MRIFFWVSLFLIVSGPLALALLLWRIQRKPERKDTEGGSAFLSVIIPARNEEKRLHRLLESLKCQNLENTEIILVDDNSADKTALLARNADLEVISAGPRPEGWQGKPWACHQGYLASKGELLLFLDADVILKPGALDAFRSLFGGQKGLFSFQPFHVTQRLYEGFSAVFNLISLASVNAFSLWGKPETSYGSFGPCLLTDRESYEAAGGHQAVAGCILDDLALCRAYHKKNRKVYSFQGKGLTDYRMYPEGFGSLYAGWMKNISLAPAFIGWKNLLFINLFIFGAFSSLSLPFILGSVKGLSLALTAGSYGLYALVFFLSFRKIGRFTSLASLFYPLSLLLFLAVFLSSFYFCRIRGKVLWKGRWVNVSEGRG